MTDQSMRFAWVVGVMALGCSIVNDPAQHTGGPSDAGTDAPPLPRIEAGQLCMRLVTLQCEQYDRCCSTAPEPFDLAGCVDLLLPPCRMGIGVYLADERTGYDPEIAAEAVGEGERLSATCSLDIARWVTVREGLFRAFAGTVAGGGDCTPTTTADFATFVSCAGIDNACMPVAADRFTCANRLDAGRSCYLNTDCVAGLACSSAVPLGPRTCGPRQADGAPCRQATDCESYLCAGATMLVAGTCIESTQDNIYCGAAD